MSARFQVRHRVLYLNEHWQEGDGGEIVLYPFLSEQPVVVVPRFGDMMFFSSQQMLHRVLPSRKPRYCLTTWIYQSHAPDAGARAAYYRDAASTAEFAMSSNPATSNTVGDAANISSAASETMMKKVLVSSFRRHLFKLFYADEWTRSLHESHLPTDAFAKYMCTHEQELHAIKAATEQMLRNFRAKDVTQPSTLPETYAQLAQKII